MRASPIALFLLAACSRAPTASDAPKIPKAEGQPDVVVITLDTTRADRLGAYGYPAARTEEIDALAQKGLRFEQAISPLPLTIPAHSTMFTGLYPHRLGIRSNGDNVLAPSFTTLAEILQGAGWVTAASVAAFVTTRQWGFNQGFDAYFDQLPEDAKDKNYWHTERSAEEVVDDAIGWLRGVREDQPVFLWVHLYDAHFPYVPRGEYATSMADRPYDAELAYVDDQIGRLVGAFAGRKVLWSVIGDHGESLGEHDELTHGLWTYQATAHVPWILSGEGVSPGVVKDPVSTADLTPTILRTLGMEIPEGLDGKPQPGSRQTPYAESWQNQERFGMAPHRAVVDGGLKYISLPKPELYDLAADPGEKTNLADTRKDDVVRLRGLLDGLGATSPSGEQAELDAETLSQLMALGYVSEGGGGKPVADPLALPDPKDNQEFFRKLSRLDMRLRKAEDAAQAIALVDELIALAPGAFELRMRRVPMLARAGLRSDIKPYLEEVGKAFPDQPRVWVTLASMALREGDLDAAFAYASRAVELAPGEAAATETLVEVLFRKGEADKAIELGTRALEKNPNLYGVAALLGRYHLRAGDYPAAERNLRIAVSGPNPRRAARVDLAMMAIAAGVRVEAFKLLHEEVEDYPGNVMARRMLARLYGEDQRWLDQKEQVEAVARARPRDASAQLAVAQCLFNLNDYLGARKSLDEALRLEPESANVLLLHANLLAKEGKKDEGYQVYLKAKALDDARRAAPQPTLGPDGRPLDPAVAPAGAPAANAGAPSAAAAAPPTPPKEAGK